MPALKHAHTYERMKKPKNEYYRCIHPDCNHYIHKEFMRGKRATCICGNEYFISLTSLALKLPHCEFCGRKPKRQLKIQDAPHLLQPAESYLNTNCRELQEEFEFPVNKFEGEFGGEL